MSRTGHICFLTASQGCVGKLSARGAHKGLRDERAAKGRLVAHLAAAGRCPLGAAAHRVRILVTIVVPPRRGARGCAAGGGVWGASKFMVP